VARWASEADAQAFAARLTDPACRAALADAFIELHGDLGAGKTTFTRHLLRALGLTGRIKSPTYAVVESYQVPTSDTSSSLDIHHFDFYRFDDPREWEEAGFRELFAQPGLKLAEWPDKAQGWLPSADLRMNIRMLPSDDEATGGSDPTDPTKTGEPAELAGAVEAVEADEPARQVTLTAQSAAGLLLLAAALGDPLLPTT
jgi:tRNA threonylcarbamoyladenosine biosynthesis protein TsaE